MDFWDLTKLLVRRWMIVLPLLILSVALAVLTLKAVKPDYTSTAHIQLVPPISGPTQPGQSTVDQRNPWLSLGLQAIGNAAIVTVTDTSVLKQMHDTGFSDSYTVTMTETSPLITFEIVAKSPDQARSTTAEVTRMFATSVANLQGSYHVAAADAISARRLDTGITVVKSSSKVKRAVVAVGGAGLLTTAGATVGLDAWLTRRRRRRDEAPSGSAPVPAGTPATATRIPATRIPAPRASALRLQSDQDDAFEAGRDRTEIIPLGTGLQRSGGQISSTPLRSGATFGGSAGKDRAEPRVSAADARTSVSKANGDEPAREKAEEPLPMPSDATIVLPVSLPEPSGWPRRTGKKS